MKYSVFLSEDKNKRTIGLYNVNDVRLTSTGFYPNIAFSDSKQTYYPISDRVMSLNGQIYKPNIVNYTTTKVQKTPVFLFTYNTENYYHFIYDSLPFLISYFELKKSIPNLKLLMSYPHNRKSQYKFVDEFLDILGLNQDIVILDPNTKYSSLYWSDSYTHGHDSNLPPRREIYDFYKTLSETVQAKYKSNIYHDKIYVSRRTNIHGQTDNIGTNYTTRRKMINEDELVDYLVSIGYQEVFTELLSTVDKILLFCNVKNVVGAIGGGMANVLFSKNCNTLALISPSFLDINYRFVHCLNQTNLNLFYDTCHVDKNEFKLYMRVKYKDIVGEIIKVLEDSIVIQYSKSNIVGWSNDSNFEEMTVKKCDCIKLDNGLNSPWKINLERAKCHITNLN